MTSQSLEAIIANVRDSSAQCFQVLTNVQIGQSERKGEERGSQSEDYRPHGKTETSEVPHHEPSMMEKIKSSPFSVLLLFKS
jgi:hypothetical protein